MQKVHFLDVLVIFRLDLGQITFNPFQKCICKTTASFSCNQHHVLLLCDSGMRRNQNFSFSVLFAAGLNLSNFSEIYEPEMQDVQVDRSQSSETTTALFVSIFYLHSAQLFLVYDAKNKLSGH